MSQDIKATATDIKPWMRRAAAEIVVEVVDTWRGGKPRPLKVEALAEAIAAHAPPVEEMAKWMREQSQHWISCTSLGKCVCGRTATLKLYDSWIQREEGEGKCVSGSTSFSS